MAKANKPAEKMAAEDKEVLNELEQLASEETPAKTSKAPVYVVAKGRSFRDQADYSEVWSEGKDVSHFAQDRLDFLEAAGHIVKK